MLTLTTNVEVVKYINHADVYQLNKISMFIQQLRVDVSSTTNINNVCFDNMVSQIYPSELQMNKVNTSDTETAF